MQKTKKLKKDSITEKVKTKPLKNYIILCILILLTIVLTLYLCDCYKVYSESQKEIPVIRGTIFEITDKELEHYIMENPSGTIYICIASDNNCRNFENDFIKLIKKENLQDAIVYLNLSNADQTNFLNDFNKKYKYKFTLTENYPALVTYEDGKITNILQEKDGKLTITKVKQFIELNKIGE